MTAIDEQPGPSKTSAEMELAIYASTAATAAIVVLRDLKVLNSANLGRLVDSLMACRLVSNGDARFEAHIEMLLDLLLPGDEEIAPPVS